MNIALIAQISAGVAFPGALSVWMFAPHWLGIYSNVDIYLSSVSTTSQNADANQQNDAPNKQEMKCKITGDDTYEESCTLKTLSTTGAAKTVIKVGDFTDEVTIPSTTTNQTTITYYKMVVSQKLLWKLPKDKASTTFSVSLNQSGNPSLTLKPLFAKDQSTITSLDNTKAIQHYIGQAVKVGETKEITKTNKYKCSFFKGDFKDCYIFDLQTTSIETLNLENVTFTSTDTQSTSIKENNFYLIKGNEWNGNFYVTVDEEGAAKDNKKMQIKELKPAFVAEVNSVKKLFHF